MLGAASASGMSVEVTLQFVYIRERWPLCSISLIDLQCDISAGWM